MVFELVGTAHAARVLVGLERLGGSARFTPLRNEARIGDQQLTRALRYLNRSAYVAAEVPVQGSRQHVEYQLTRLGADALSTLRSIHSHVHGQTGAMALVTDQALEAILA